MEEWRLLNQQLFDGATIVANNILKTQYLTPSVFDLFVALPDVGERTIRKFNAQNMKEIGIMKEILNKMVRKRECGSTFIY
jgi:hypothetical protein